MFFEKGVRGGASYISKRYRKFSNKYFKSYDSKHIVDICYAMCKFFARGEFKWIEPIEFDLEVDLEYVKQIRELHKYYLLDPDKTKIKKQILSNYQLKIADFHNTHIGNV